MLDEMLDENGRKEEKAQSGNKQGGGGQDAVSRKINESLDTAEKSIKETEAWLAEQKKSRALIEKDRGQEQQPGGRGGGLGIGKVVEALGDEKEGRDI